MPRLSERELARLLRERFQSADESVRLGIGDDAALLEGHADDWAFSVDASVDGVHFDRRLLTLEDVGYRAFQAAASDLAAMGAAPAAALSALILPKSMSRSEIEALTAGQALASDECGCPVVGGNISRGGELSVTTTVIGRCSRALRRDAARPGHELWLVGSVGLAAAGFACARLGRPGTHVGDDERLAGRRAVSRCVEAWRRPRALIGRGAELVGRASACIDISDGLAADAWQLARASGVRVVIEQDRLRTALEPALIEVSRALRKSALRFALYGGEDYALLATGHRQHRPPWAHRIGYVTRGTGAVLRAFGASLLVGTGYDHLRAR